MSKVSTTIAVLYFILGVYISFQLHRIYEKVSYISSTVEDFNVLLDQ